MLVGGFAGEAAKYGELLVSWLGSVDRKHREVLYAPSTLVANVVQKQNFV